MEQWILSSSERLSAGLSPGNICTAEAMGHLIEAGFVTGIDVGPFSISGYAVFLSRDKRALSIDLAVLGTKGSGTLWDASVGTRPPLPRVGRLQKKFIPCPWSCLQGGCWAFQFQSGSLAPRSKVYGFKNANGAESFLSSWISDSSISEVLPSPSVSREDSLRERKWC